MPEPGWETTSATDEGAVLKRRPLADDSEMDITPMIDITFLLLIFFLVASVPDSQTAVQLPSARFGKGVDPKICFVVTIAEGATPGTALVYIGDGKVGEPLSTDISEQEQELQKAVEEGFADGSKSAFLVKAEKGVLHRDVSRVASFASVADKPLYMAVMEAE